MQRVSCPHCSQKIRIKQTQDGDRLCCPKCRQSLQSKASQPSTDDTVDNTAAQEAVRTAVATGDTTLNLHQRNPYSASPNASRPGSTSERDVSTKFGRFQINSLLGAGGFGKVYKAYDPSLDRYIALKVPNFGNEDQHQITRFLAEAKAAARLKHPNIVTTFESGRTGEHYYIASEYIEGELLSERIKRDPPSTRDAANIIRKLAEALEYAHASGIIHRDLKPHNVILDVQGEPQLMDFGLAKRIDDDAHLTTDGALLGTPAYMSLEQARGELSLVDALSDQYSLGVVLYHLLTGSPPHQGAAYVIVSQVAQGIRHSPREKNQGVDVNLNAICQKAMMPDRRGRYASCAQLASDLLAWTESRPVLARPLTRLQEMGHLCRKHKLAVGTTVGVMLIISVAATASMVLAARAMDAESRATASAEVAKLEQAKAVDEAKRAREAEKKARLSEAEALRATESALAARKAEQQANEQLQIERDRATAAAEAARSEQQKAATALARTNYFLAREYTQQDRFTEARKILEAVPNDDRPFEWRLAYNALDESAATLRGHSGPVKALCVTPDGEYLVSGGTDSTIRLWEVRSKRQSHVLADNAGPVQDLALNADGSLLASCDGSAVVRIWDLKQRSIRTEINAKFPVFSVSLDPAGDLLAVGSGGKLGPSGDVQGITNGTVAMVRLKDETLLWSKPLQGVPVVGVHFDPAGEYLLINLAIRSTQNARNAGAILLDPKIGRTLGDLRFFSSSRPFGRLCLNQSGTVAFDGRFSVRVTDDASEGVKQWPEVQWAEYDSVLAGGQDQFLAGSSNGTLVLYNTQDSVGYVPRRFGGHETRITAICFGGDQTAAFSADETGVIKCWNLGDPVQSVATDRLARIHKVALSSSGQHLAVGDDEGKVIVLQRNPLMQLFQVNANPSNDSAGYAMQISPDGRFLAITNDRKRDVELRDIATGSIVKVFHGHTANVRELSFSSDGNLLASVSGSRNLHVWDAKLDSIPRKLWSRQHTDTVLFSPDGAMLIGSHSSTLHAWDSITGSERPLPPLRQIQSSWRPVCLSSDGSKLVVNDGDMLAVWDCVTGERLSEFRCVQDDNSEPPENFAFTPDNTRLLSFGEAPLIWDWQTGREVLAFESAAFAMRPDGHEFALVNPTQNGLRIQFQRCAPVQQ
jgi:WD40 repeat protein/tRNA A-37 threonylcarbamoyl transferase component Bud32